MRPFSTARIAHRDFASCHNLGIETRIGVVERTPEGGDNIEVPLCGGWIELGCRASGYRRDHPQPSRSDGDFRVDPVVLTPGRYSIEIDVRAKSDRIHRDAVTASSAARLARLIRDTYL